MADNLQQSTSIESRVSFLENKIKDLELRLSQIESPAVTIPTGATPNALSQPSNAPNKHISIILLNKNFHQADYMVGDSGDRIDLSLQFTNHLKKDIRAFTGTVVFKDLFERDILRIGLTDESGIRVGSTSQWKGGIEYDQFLENHNRLLSVGKTDLMVEFLLERVIYMDGTRDVFTE